MRRAAAAAANHEHYPSNRTDANVSNEHGYAGVLSIEIVSGGVTGQTRDPYPGVVLRRWCINLFDTATHLRLETSNTHVTPT